jgi:intracellular septation protein
MKLLFDFLPLIIFFVVGKIFNIYIGTAVLIVACCLQVIIYKLIYKRIDKTLLITSITVIVLGAITLFTQEEIFIKWKPTVIYWALAIILLASQWVGKGKTLIQRGLEKNITLPEPVWKKLNFTWVVFFLVLGVINTYVAYNFSSDTWLNFKLFGATLLTLTFAVVQMLFLHKYIDLDNSHPNKPKK